MKTTQEFVKKYISLLKQGKDSEAQNLKVSMLPDTLFKYRPLSENTLNCLENDSVWISPADKQNDPFESSLSFSDKEYAMTIFTNPNFKSDFKIIYNQDISNKEVQEIINNTEPKKKFIEICKLKNINRKYDDEFDFGKIIADSKIKELRKKIMLSSFSERNDSILMWSHYSDNHKGICIEYDFKEDEDIVDAIEPTFYSENLFSLVKAFASKDINNIMKRAAITKAIDWQYEKEWRILDPIKKVGHMKVPKPIAIYLGACFSDNDNISLEKRLVKKCTESDIPIYKMKLHDLEYKIVKK